MITAGDRKNMLARNILCLIVLMSVVACAQTRSTNLPEGISFLKGINYSGLRSPIWSPDGKRIVASYVIEAMPDIAGIFSAEPRHDIVVIDTETWKTSIFTSEKSGSLDAEAWSPDSNRFALYWSDGPNGYGVYAFEINSTQPTLLSTSKFGVVSPDLEKVAFLDDGYLYGNHNLEITNIVTNEVHTFKVPYYGQWKISAWSSDMELLTLVYRKSENDRFENIYMLSLDSGNFLQFTSENSFFKHSPAISPNGQLIAYVMWRFTDSKIENKLIVSKLDHSCEWTIPVDNIDYFAWSPDSQRMFLIGTDGVYIANLNILFGNDFLNRNHCP